jgi:phosphocarrier protein FPr
MAPPELAVSAVGGLAEDETLLGTDAVQIAEALQRHTGPAGALILVDLGSAVISTELALDLLPADLRGRCRISNAALVEGAVIAAVEAGLGHSLEEVNRAAEAAWTMTKTAEAP